MKLFKYNPGWVSKLTWGYFVEPLDVEEFFESLFAESVEGAS